MLIRPARGIPYSEVTPRHLYVSRRQFLGSASAATLGVLAGHGTGGGVDRAFAQAQGVLSFTPNPALSTDETFNSLDEITSYNNFYEFGPDKGDPARYAHEMTVRPWKYGFKSIKSIVKIELVREQPATAWNLSAPREYGFYANVNPEVDHPRWTQSRERRIGKFFRQKTLMFNGYADEVGHLYAGMDLRLHF